MFGQVCTVATLTHPSTKTSLLEYATVTDDAVPPFMRPALKSKRLVNPIASLAAIPTGSDLANAFLKAHNDYRAAHKTPALAWDDTLAAAADAYASKCVYAHDADRGAGIGENIYASGSSQPLSATDVSWGGASTTAWYNEIKDWNFATSASKGGVTGHFTQVVWKASTKLGCGVASCPGMLMANSIFVVCRYSPQGNFKCPTCTPPSTYDLNVLPKK